MPYSKYSAKQRRLAAVAPPRTKITGADLAKLRKKEKKEKMKLTTRQKNTLKKHQETHGHTKAHMDYMKRKMREGMSFTDAHRLAMRKKGK